MARMSTELPRSVEHLAAATEAGKSFEYLMFFGADPGPELTRACLSNWWEQSFELDGLEWPTVEHAMMYAKAKLFGDGLRMEQIRTAKTPKAAKALGRKVAPYGELAWGAHRYGAVTRACAAKFGQNADLRAFLQATEGKVLVEASPWDRIWGIGLRATDAAANDPRQWKGANLLGFVLMDVRDRLK